MAQGLQAGNGLLLLATLISIEIAQNLTAEQLELLSTFFEVLGDNLALLALCSDSSECCQPENK